MSLSFLTSAIWHNEPTHWSMSDEELRVTCAPNSDFWQQTYYGFVPDSGHFFGCEVEGDFCATVEFSGSYRVLYDQVGLMLRRDRTHWIKTGIEYSDGVTNFSTVVTRDLSDWSVVQRPAVSGPQAVRLTRVKDAILTHYRDDEGQWQLMRLANFSVAGIVTLGPVACSPLRDAGDIPFEAIIHRFEVGTVPPDPLHDMPDQLTQVK